jgi:hypothetical protein
MRLRLAIGLLLSCVVRLPAEGAAPDDPHVPRCRFTDSEGGRAARRPYRARRLNSRTGITIYGMIDTGNIEDTDTISGWVVWARVRYFA